MKRKLAVSETEWEILKMLWKHGESIRQSELLSLFEKEGREWKRQTLNTFLSRLEKKGLVRREGGMATPVYNEEEYNDFVNNCKKSSIYDTGVTANYGDQLLTLSTCEYSQEDGRFVVVAKKVNN